LHSASEALANTFDDLPLDSYFTVHKPSRLYHPNKKRTNHIDVTFRKTIYSMEYMYNRLIPTIPFSTQISYFPHST
jgi:hypothetical protein